MGKICLSCGQDYLPTRNGQKYCFVCGPIIRKAYVVTWKKTNAGKVNEENGSWRKANPEKSRASSAKWRKANPEKIREKDARYGKANPEKVKANRVNWAIANPEKAKVIKKRKDHKYYETHLEKATASATEWKAANPEKAREIAKREKAKRRAYGFVPLNSFFIGSEGHHVNQNDVIYIPKELHRSIYHRQSDGVGMDKINALAYEWMGRN